MTFQLEYNELKTDALDAIGSLYQGWVKRLDSLAEKSEEAWAQAWIAHRAGDGSELDAITPLLPEWMQAHFSKFSALYRFASEVERAFIHYENEISEAYRLGLQRGRELAVKPKSSQTLTPKEKEARRVDSFLNAMNTWPELFTS